MVPAILIYLLKANIALTLFFLAYRLGLRRLTFYTLNRLFLLTGIVFSSLYPFVSIDTFINKHETLAGSVMTYVPDLAGWQVTAPVFTVWTALVYIFWTGVSAMAIRFCIQLFSLWKIHRRSQRGEVASVPVQLLQQPVNPFSFFKHIYINPSLHQPEELPAILRHEKVHVQQWHSADVLLGELNNIFYWFNPGAWLMKTAIRENLEFITDRYLLRQGVDKTAYQYNLIKVSGIPYATAIANNFNFSHLKNRIIMMNSKRSSGYQLVRYLVLGILVGGLVLSLNYSKASSAIHFISKTDTVPPPPPAPPLPPPPPPAPPKTKTVNVTFVPAVAAGQAAPSHDVYVTGVKSIGEPVYVVDGQVIAGSMKDYVSADMIESIDVVKDGSAGLITKYGPKAKNGVIFVKLKNTGNGIRITDKGTAARTIPADAVVIVDGKRLPHGEDMNAIPPDDIEKVEVIKGESATIIGGEEAKGGIIRITTKKGAAAKVTGVNTIKVTSQSGWQVKGYKNGGKAGGIDTSYFIADTIRVQ